jgi:hypothetical protein
LKSIDIVYFEAGSGHKTAAEGLRRAVLERHPDWDCRMVDLAEILRYDWAQAGRLVCLLIDQFNACMRREKYVGFREMVGLAIWFSRMSSTYWFYLVRWGMSQYWRGRCPDMIVSVTPMFNAVLYQAARRMRPDVVCVTIPVDHEEARPGYWFEPHIKQHYLLAGNRLLEQARLAGVKPAEIHTISGMIIDPGFYGAPQRSRSQLDAEFGLDPALPLGVISFGCQGTVNVLRIARQIAAEGLAINLLCLCGKNQQLQADVRDLKTPHPCVAVGFRPEPPCDLLYAANVLIGKPGTMTLNEAIITGTPFVALESDGLKPIQEGNEVFVVETGIGLVAGSIEDVPAAVRQVLTQPQYPGNLKRAHHTGVFDAVKEIERLLGQNGDAG